MPKIVTPLSAKAVQSLQHNGVGRKTMHPVGVVDGLYLVIYETGSRSWLFRAMLNGRRRHFGLGSARFVTLAEAREKAKAWKKLIAEGIDPIASKKAVEERRINFADAVDLFSELELQDVKEKERKAWRSSLNTHIIPWLGKRDVNTITSLQVAEVMKPLWIEKREMAKKLRIRLDKIFVWLKAKGYRTDDSPAKWADLKPILNPLGRDKVTQHRPAIPFVQAPTWFSLLRQKEPISARALEFLCLTAVRSGDVRFLTWKEIDFDSEVWTIPPNREGTKLKTRHHTVPLTAPMMKLLRDAEDIRFSDYVFPGVNGGPMSDSTISKIMREIHNDEVNLGRSGFLDQQTGKRAVPHGLRSTFRDWVAELTDYPGELAEIAIAHKQGSDTELAYKRMSQVEKRRPMMADWGEYLRGGSN